MSISAVSGPNWLFASPARQNLPGNSLPSASDTNGAAIGAGTAPTSSSSGSDDAVQKFMNYMNETPAQRLQNAWLQQHGITPQAFAAMSSADKQKIIDEMKQDIEAKLKQKMETGTAAKPSVNIVV